MRFSGSEERLVLFDSLCSQFILATREGVTRKNADFLAYRSLRATNFRIANANVWRVPPAIRPIEDRY